MNENETNRFYSFQNEIIKNYSQKQEKYVYYIIALCVASIGFSVQLTSGTKINLLHILLGLALVSWSVSIYNGLRFIRFSLNIIYFNNEQFKIAGRQEKCKKMRDDEIKNESEKISTKIKSDTKKQENLFKLLNIGFYLGVLFFLLWHIIEMI